MEEKVTKQLNIAIGVVFVVAAGILVAMAVSRQSKGGDETPVSSATGTPSAPTGSPEYDGLKGMKEVSLASNFESWTPDGKRTDDKTVSKHLVVSGNVAEAYLAVKASEGSNALTKYDSIFVKFNYTGGHLFRPSTLAVPADSATSLLYNLHDVPVLPSVPYDESRTPDHANMMDTLKYNHTVLVTAFISSLRQSQLGTLSLYYACASGSDCSIDVR